MTTIPTLTGSAIGNTGIAALVIPVDSSIPVGSWMVAILGTTNGTSNVPTASGWEVLKAPVTAGSLSTTILRKKRVTGETSYTFTYPTDRVSGGMIVGINGGSDTGWIVGSDFLRGGSTANQYISKPPSITTTVVNTLDLAIAVERTSAAGDTISWSGATAFAFKSDWATTSGSPAIGVAYNNMSTVGTTAVPTATFNNLQVNNGYGVQIGVPPIADVITQPVITTTSGMKLWTGSAQVDAKLTVWNGTTEIAIPEVYGSRGITPAVVSDITNPVNQPFYIAHRGGSGNWPEMTAFAYQQAHEWPMKALEISVHKTSDGIFACFHDANTLRVTGEDHVIKDTPWSVISQLTITASATDNPSQPRRPVARLEQLLNKYAATHVIFIEDKTYTNANNLLNIMDSYPNSTEHFVWKASGPGGGIGAAQAKARGYKSWGYYFTGADMTSLVTTAANYTFIGLDYNLTNQQLSDAFASISNPVIGHIMPSKAQSDRMIAAGAIGNMVANVKAVLPHSTTVQAPVNPTYSVFGTNDYPFTLSVVNEDPVRVANAFYSFGPTAAGRRIVGARLFVPSGASYPTNANIGLHSKGNATGLIDLSQFVTQITMQNIKSGWNEVLFSVPIEMIPGVYYYISYDFGNGQYAYASDNVSAYYASSQLSGFVEADGDQGESLPHRGAYRYSDGLNGDTTSHYGIDILIDTGNSA